MTCEHLAELLPVSARSNGCEECLRDGTRWVHLRKCLTCGHVGCCDSSRGHHARGHWEQTRHPIMASLEPGEHWAWCWIDEIFALAPPEPPPAEQPGA